jgi:hypothetical protein
VQYQLSSVCTLESVGVVTSRVYKKGCCSNLCEMLGTSRNDLRLYSTFFIVPIGFIVIVGTGRLGDSDRARVADVEVC